MNKSEELIISKKEIKRTKNYIVYEILRESLKDNPSGQYFSIKKELIKEPIIQAHNLDLK